MSVLELPQSQTKLNGIVIVDRGLSSFNDTVLSVADLETKKLPVIKIPTQVAPTPTSEKEVQINDLFSTIESGITVSEKKDYAFIQAQIIVSLKKEGLSAVQTLTESQFLKVYDRVRSFLRENDRTFSWYGHTDRVLTNLKISMGMEQVAISKLDVVKNVQPVVNFLNQSAKYMSIQSANDSWLESQGASIISATIRLGEEIESIKRQIKMASNTGKPFSGLEIQLKQVEEAFLQGQLIQSKLDLTAVVLDSADVLVTPVPASEMEATLVPDLDVTSSITSDTEPVAGDPQTLIVANPASLVEADTVDLNANTQVVVPMPSRIRIVPINPADKPDVRVANQLGGIRRRLRSQSNMARTLPLANGRILAVDPLPSAIETHEPNSLEKLNTSLETWLKGFNHNRWKIGKGLRTSLVAAIILGGVHYGVLSNQERSNFIYKETIAGAKAFVGNPEYANTMDINGLTIEKRDENTYAFFYQGKELTKAESEELFPNINSYVEKALANYPTILRGLNDDDTLRARIKQVMIAYAKTSSRCELSTIGQMRPVIKDGKFLSAPEVLNPDLSLQTVIAINAPWYDASTNCN